MDGASPKTRTQCVHQVLEIAAKYNEKIPTKSEDIKDNDNDKS